MTFLEKQMALLSDLMVERVMYPNFRGMYDRKIAEMREAIYGSGAGDSTGGSTELPDVSSRPSQVVREGGDANGAVSV